jgi:CheY-like chemotaxis protein
MSKTRVLIVDDDVNLSRLSGMILENSGLYEVLTENHSARALAVARQFRPHVMLLDVDMPSKTGGDLAGDASNDPVLRDVPILFVTGLLSKSETGDKEMDCGGMVFLAKPVTPEVLLDSVAKLAGAHNLLTPVSQVL